MRIVIIGAGGHGRVVLDILRNNHQFEVAGFLDTDARLHKSRVDGIEVLGDFSLITTLHELAIEGAIVAIGDNSIRRRYAELIEQAEVPLVSAIHPSANIARTAHIGKNVVIAQGVNICPHAQVADSAICNTGSIVEHECRISQGAHICPGVRLAGHVLVEPGAFVGIGATVIQNLKIGECAVVGAGAVVVGDVPAYTTVVGMPARVVSRTHLPGATGAIVPSADERNAHRLEQAMAYRPRRKAPGARQLANQS